MSLDDEWGYFLENDNLDNFNQDNLNQDDFYINNNFLQTDKEEINNNIDNNYAPKASDIYISTKTKIVYLNIKDIDINQIFWKIDILDYNIQKEGIIKKQIKISLPDKEKSIELDKELEKMNNFKINNVKIKIINKLENDIINNDRGKYKDIRKLSIGLSKKDITIKRCKEKSAFYNCFVLTLRIFDNENFKEFHVKVFNTGKLEIPGIQDDETLYKIIEHIIYIISNILNTKITYYNNIENVLINSNFNCGFFINRENLFNILRNKYLINATYDPCSYPGIQCVYYHDLNTDKKADEIVNNKNICKISYMIFRTGSILIVGKCSEEILKNHVYKYIKELLEYEYKNIYISNNLFDLKNQSKKEVKNKKIKKKVLLFTNQ